VGYDLDTIQTKSPSELDILCPHGISVESTFFPVRDAISGTNEILFDNVQFDDRGRLIGLEWPVNAPPVDGLPLNSITYPDFTFRGFCSTGFIEVDFTHLTSNGNLSVSDPLSSNPTENDLLIEMFNNGSKGPSTVTTNYTDIINCRNCFGVLYKLGTDDSYGRIDANPEFMTGVLINANSGEIKNTTDFTFSTPSKLPLSPCMTNKFQGSSVQPYGILTSQLVNSPTVINASSETPSYFEFDLRYKYEISWDNTNWYAATNKWTVKYGPQPSNNPSFSFVGDIDNYYQNNMPPPISASISSLDFDPITISTKISVNWGGNGILIGNSDCSFSDTKLSKIGETRSIPSLTVSSENPGTDCVFTPVLQQLSEPNDAPYWTISSVGLVCNDKNYTIGESLKVAIGNGDTEEIKAELKITSGDDRVSPTLTISGGGGNGNAVFAPTLSSSGSPTVWSLSGGSASGGSGYVNGSSLTITTNPEDVTITPAKASVVARGEPSITASATSGNGAILSVQLSQEGSPPVWSVSKVNVTNGGTNYINYSNVIFTTSDNIETNASAILLTTSLPPVLSINEYINMGNGAELQININGPYESENCEYTDYYEIDIVIVNGGNGYDPNTDSFTLDLDDDTVISRDGSSEYSGFELHLYYSVDINGTIISIDGLEDPDTLAGLPVGIFRFYKSSGTIKCIKINNGGQYYSNTGAAYGISVIDGGEYYKPGDPVVEIVNGGKYYHIEASYVRAVSGPCINNIKMDIWHPGPCGISEALKTETSANTPWQNISGGTYYNDLIENTYRKFWIVYDYDNLANQAGSIGRNDFLVGGCGPSTPPTGSLGGEWQDCPCYVITQLGFGVVKYEGCEARPQNIGWIPLRQWEMDITHIQGGWLIKPEIYSRECEPLGTDWSTLTNEFLHSRVVCNLLNNPQTLNSTLEYIQNVGSCYDTYYSDNTFDPYKGRQQISTTNSPYSMDVVNNACYTFPNLNFCEIGFIVTNGIFPWQPYDNTDCP
jgi:hypothetical protein